MVVDELKRRLDDPRYDGLSFGVLSLFRDQIERIEELGFRPHVSRGEQRTIIGVIGDTDTLAEEELQKLPGVLQVVRITKEE